MEKIKIDKNLKESINKLILTRSEITKRFQDNNESSSSLLKEEISRVETEVDELREWFKDFYMIKILLPESFKDFDSRWSVENKKYKRASDCNIKVQVQFPSFSEVYTLNLLIEINALDLGEPDKYEFNIGTESCLVVEGNRHMVDYFRNNKKPNEFKQHRLDLMIMEHSGKIEPIEFLEKSLPLIQKFYENNLNYLSIRVEKDYYVDIEKNGNGFNVISLATKNFINELIFGFKENKTPNIKNAKSNETESVEVIWGLINKNIEKNKLNHNLKETLISKEGNQPRKVLKI